MDYTELLTQIIECLRVIATFYGLIMILGIAIGSGFLGSFITDLIMKSIKKRKEYKERTAKYDN